MCPTQRFISNTKISKRIAKYLIHPHLSSALFQDEVLNTPQPHFKNIKQCYPHYFHKLAKNNVSFVYYSQPGLLKMQELNSLVKTIHIIHMFWTFIHVDYSFNVVRPLTIVVSVHKSSLTLGFFLHSLSPPCVCCRTLPLTTLCSTTYFCLNTCGRLPTPVQMVRLQEVTWCHHHSCTGD